jgi:hypothetical protein
MQHRRIISSTVTTKHPGNNLLTVIPGAWVVIVSYVERYLLHSGKRYASLDTSGGVYLHSSGYLRCGVRT